MAHFTLKACKIMWTLGGKNLYLPWLSTWFVNASLLDSAVMRMNFYNHHIRSIFKSHSISVTFKLGAQGIRVTCVFEYAPNMMIVKVHPQ